MKKILLAFMSLMFYCTLMAQPAHVFKRFSFEPSLHYNPAIPSPETHLGYELGSTLTVHAHVVDYFETLAAASKRVTINEYGKTYEGRPLINLVITSEKNHSNLENIRQEHLKMVSVGLSETEANRLITELPVVTSMSYNIHGNEASSTEAAMQVAYRLAAAQDSETMEVLDNSVIIMYICINPDGRDRFAYWSNSVRRSVYSTNTGELEHSEPWPGGRTNHYWFDLNRDWVWGVHPESRGHTAEYVKWMPQVHVDYHEQGANSNYFTAPGTTPRNLLLPSNYEALSDTFGRANIAQFDKHQLNYFTREAFDFFYPGYGSSYPSVMGGIGMLTEQGSARGISVDTDDGYVLTLRQGIFDHYTTSIATMKKAAERRELLRRYSYEAWQPENSKSPEKAYFFPPQDNPYLSDVVNMLLHHGVEVNQTSGDLSVSAAMNFRNGKKERKRFPAGTYVVSTNQPLHLFVNSVLGRNMAIEDSVMYDMATWSAPLAYNLEAYSSEVTISNIGKPISAAPKTGGRVINLDAQYAYAIEWNQRNAPRALAMLWDKGYRVRASVEPFKRGEKTFSAGSLIILNGRNLEKQSTITSDLQGIANSTGVIIEGFDTGRIIEGKDLASTRNRPVKQPKVALLVDGPFSSYTSGQIYFLFDWETRLPVNRIRASNLQQSAFRSGRSSADLNDYDVLILPGGGGGLKQMFGKEQLAELKRWVSGGGVIVATESAAAFFTAKQSKFTNVKLVASSRDSSETAKYLPYADRRDYNGKKRIPGSALNGKIDITHPLAFGVQPEVYSLKLSLDALEPDANMQTVGYYDKDVTNLLTAGYASEENLERLNGKTFAGVVPVGRGKVVLLPDNTHYRMFWRGPSRMMQNAVMLLPGF